MGTREGDNLLKLKSAMCLIKHKRVASGGGGAVVVYSPEVQEEGVRLKRVMQGWVQETSRLIAVAKVIKGVIRRRIKQMHD